MSGARDPAAMLARFPKTRPPLPPRLAAIYTRQYLDILARVLFRNKN